MTMALTTAHIGFAIRDHLEGRVIQGDEATRNDPFSDEQYEIEFVDISDVHNPVLHTSGGVFKVVILKMGPSTMSAEERDKIIEHHVPKSLLWKPDKNDKEDGSD
jgi:hypothetical protein